MKVGIATQELTRIDAALGAARHLMLFEVSAEGIANLGIASFEPAGRPGGHHERLAPRLEALEGCALVFVADVGPDGEGALASRHITPLRRFAGKPIADALDAVQNGLRRNSSRWLRLAEQGERRRDR